ncbi:innexin unc-7-like [Octopus sinensis]|uniref:Innexin n=1 Tax=Octopus sinensis TaxID=2607531 RepID=A0A6P7U5S2_9MOLL|nr:innexin unc-7-like [Octopus sinensis]
MAWRSYVFGSGLNLPGIVNKCLIAHKIERISEKEKIANEIAYQIDHYLRRRDNWDGTSSRVVSLIKMLMWSGGRKHGNYLSFAYCITKTLFLLNAFGQFFLLNRFLGFQFHMYGFHILNEYIHGKEINESSFFPRVTYCDIPERTIKQTHIYTVQCVLQQNLFSEKIFIIIWYMLLIVGVATLISYVKWLLYFSIPRLRDDYVSQYIQDIAPTENDQFTKFINKYLKNDGFFICRLIDLNINCMMLDTVVNILWQDFKNKKLNN